MSTEQPENDPFRKPGHSEPPPSGSGSPYGSAPPPPPPGGDPYGGGPPPPGGGPYGGGPYDNPYGDRGGAADPLAGMPPLASRGKRLLARIIDALIIGIPVGIVMGLIQGGYDWNDTDDSAAQGGVYTLVYLIYEGIMLTRDGQTLGKKAMRIRVAMLSNGAVPQGSPGWVRAVVYQVPPLVPCIGFLFWLVNVLFCTWDKPYQQCVHDKAAKTVVVATP
ncbi:RDD family protein [Streptomyces sp. HNM0574]|uniref:RDD family protein n=1 Tax=Streptomyces sp. HNM0574 TaxID=2714954 RepID=UPI00146F1477|nr:RDD family protein [Streptomyces sp. HNM0574]NLU66554.1 RDD family protein [Streptomyces sp. HNM0574]